MMSLQHCLECFSQEVPPEPKKIEKPELPGVPPPEKPRAQAADAVQLTAFYRSLDNKTLAQTVEEARQTVSGGPGNDTTPSGTLPPGTRSVFQIVSNAMANRPPRRLANAAGLRATGMENVTSQPEPIPMSNFTPVPVPETRPAVEVKPAANPIKRALNKVSAAAAPETSPAIRST